MKFEDSTIDHIIPQSMGGTHSPENTQMMCYLCNRSKDDKSVWDEIDRRRQAKYEAESIGD